MKTNTRVRRDSSKKTAIPQVRIAPESAPGTKGNSHSQANATEQPEAERDVTGLFLMRDGLEIAGLDYSAEELAQIENVAKYRGQSLSEFLLAAVTASRKNMQLIDKLEAGINMISALFDLMEHWAFHPPEADPTEEWKCGIVGLSSAAFGELQRARDAMDCALVAKGGAR
jgi:hypothetical protein